MGQLCGKSAASDGAGVATRGGGSTDTGQQTQKQQAQKQQASPASNGDGKLNGGASASANPDLDAVDVKLKQQQDEEVDESTEEGPFDPGRERAGYVPAPNPLDDEARVQTLHSMPLQRQPEKRFDDITNLCCMIFKVPFCLVTIIDKEKQWVKSAINLSTEGESDRRQSFCSWTLLPEFPTVLVVENALADVRFSSNPLVIGFPHIRFYSGTPLLTSNGHRLGALCIIDNKPRQFSAENCAMLANFGEMVVREVEKEQLLEDHRHKNQELAEQRTKLVRAMNTFTEAIMLCDFSEPTWPIVFVNEAWESATGMHRAALEKTPSFWDWFRMQGDEDMVDKTRLAYSRAVEKDQNFNLTVTQKQQPVSSASSGGSNAPPTVFMLQFRCANNSNIDQETPNVVVPAMQQQDNKLKYYYITVRNALNKRGSIDSASSATTTAATASASRLFSLVDDQQSAFDDVTLGPMLGYGSFGRVYRGTWNSAAVAIKVLEHSQQADGRQDFEALLSTKISHPNVVRTFKHCTRHIPIANKGGAEEGNEFLVETWMIMEFCNKGTVSDAAEVGKFRRTHSLWDINYSALLATARDIAAAMCYLHSLDIIHGDLTGSNVLLSASDADERKFIAKVADFGFSRILSAGDVNTKSHGAVSHTPPELLLAGQLSKAVDVYAFGVILWELYTGQRPYRGLTQGQVIKHISNKRGLSLNSECPPPLSKFINRCISFRVEERPTFAQILGELELLEEELC